MNRILTILFILGIAFVILFFWWVEQELVTTEVQGAAQYYNYTIGAPDYVPEMYQVVEHFGVR